MSKKIDGKVVEVVVQDVAGNMQAKQLVSLYCKQADCVILCYDLTRRRSFELVDEWLLELNDDPKAKQLPIVLLATKEDLALEKRSVTKSAGSKKKEFIGERCFLF